MWNVYKKMGLWQFKLTEKNLGHSQRKAQKPDWVLWEPPWNQCAICTPDCGKFLMGECPHGCNGTLEGYWPNLPGSAHCSISPPSHWAHTFRFTSQMGMVSQGAVWAPTEQQGLTVQKDKLLHEMPQSIQGRTQGTQRTKRQHFRNSPSRFEMHGIGYSPISSTVKPSSLLKVAFPSKARRVQSSWPIDKVASSNDTVNRAELLYKLCGACQLLSLLGVTSLPVRFHPFSKPFLP